MFGDEDDAPMLVRSDSESSKSKGGNIEMDDSL
jgi:hypothetical protein